MGLFHKNSIEETNNQQNNNLPEYVDTLLEQADLESVPELGPQIADNKPYGIDDAIELMRRLPGENTQLVVSVVKETLSSANINVEDVIADAHSKITGYEQHLDTLASEIDALKAQIAQKQSEITGLQTNLEETGSVKQLLQNCSRPASPAASQIKQSAVLSNKAERANNESKPDETPQHRHAKVV